MIFFVILFSLYVGFLTFYRPQPVSLKENPPSLSQNFNQIKSSIILGGALIFIFFLITKLSFTEVDRSLYGILGLNNLKEAAILWPYQLFSHLLIHANLEHLLANVIGIGLLSVYERRVGSGRFVMVLIIGALCSIPSILFYSDLIVMSGISGGVFALGAAYFTDYEKLSTKDWVYAILGFAVLAVVFTFTSESRSPGTDGTTIYIDHLGHLFGAIGGILYCRLRPLDRRRQLA